MRPACRHHAADGAFGTKQMILPHHFGQGFGPQPVGQGPRRVLGQAAGFEQIAHEWRYNTGLVAGSSGRSPKLAAFAAQNGPPDHFDPCGASAHPFTDNVKRRPPRSITMSQ